VTILERLASALFYSARSRISIVTHAYARLFLFVNALVANTGAFARCDGPVNDHSYRNKDTTSSIKWQKKLIANYRIDLPIIRMRRTSIMGSLLRVPGLVFGEDWQSVYIGSVSCTVDAT
jgi:hypothetical protein